MVEMRWRKVLAKDTMSDDPYIIVGEDTMAVLQYRENQAVRIDNDGHPVYIDTKWQDVEVSDE